MATAQRNNRFLAAGLTTLAALAAAIGGVVLAPAVARLLAAGRSRREPMARPGPAAALLSPLAAAVAAAAIFVPLSADAVACSARELTYRMFMAGRARAVVAARDRDARRGARCAVRWRQALPLAVFVYGGAASFALSRALERQPPLRALGRDRRRHGDRGGGGRAGLDSARPLARPAGPGRAGRRRVLVRGGRRRPARLAARARAQGRGCPRGVRDRDAGGRPPASSTSTATATRGRWAAATATIAIRWFIRARSDIPGDGVDTDCDGEDATRCAAAAGADGRRPRSGAAEPRPPARSRSTRCAPTTSAATATRGRRRR